MLSILTSFVCLFNKIILKNPSFRDSSQEKDISQIISYSDIVFIKSSSIKIKTESLQVQKAKNLPSIQIGIGWEFPDLRTHFNQSRTEARQLKPIN